MNSCEKIIINLKQRSALCKLLRTAVEYAGGRLEYLPPDGATTINPQYLEWVNRQFRVEEIPEEANWKPWIPDTMSNTLCGFMKQRLDCGNRQRYAACNYNDLIDKVDGFNFPDYAQLISLLLDRWTLICKLRGTQGFHLDQPGMNSAEVVSRINELENEIRQIVVSAGLAILNLNISEGEAPFVMESNEPGHLDNVAIVRADNVTLDAMDKHREQHGDSVSAIFHLNHSCFSEKNLRYNQFFNAF